MTYRDQWTALSARVRGLLQAAELYARFLAIRSSDSYQSYVHIREQIEDIRASLLALQSDFDYALPRMAHDAIGAFSERAAPLIRDHGGNPASRQERVWAALVSLGAFEAEMSFILSDTQESIRARSERAFVHLQRSIVADESFGAKWRGAFDAGEVECEKLGAVHLLLHGIWAFKVNASGGRTDLVFQEPSEDTSDQERYAEGIVLTEWKKAPTETEIEQKFTEARLQAQRYARGVLGGSELATYRYVIVVSRREARVPGDVTENGITYRNINIAVEPGPPSRQ